MNAIELCFEKKNTLCLTTDYLCISIIYDVFYFWCIK